MPYVSHFDWILDKARVYGRRTTGDMISFRKLVTQYDNISRALGPDGDDPAGPFTGDRLAYETELLIHEHYWGSFGPPFPGVDPDLPQPASAVVFRIPESTQTARLSRAPQEPQAPQASRNPQAQQANAASSSSKPAADASSSTPRSQATSGLYQAPHTKTSAPRKQVSFADDGSRGETQAPVRRQIAEGKGKGKERQGASNS